MEQWTKKEKWTKMDPFPLMETSKTFKINGAVTVYLRIKYV